MAEVICSFLKTKKRYMFFLKPDFYKQPQAEI